VIAFLLTLLMAQGIPGLPGDSGIVSGIVRTSEGTPAAGVRVSAMVASDIALDAGAATSFSALAQSDEQGRYRLEGIPAGRYYIAAGRVDLPTYYPGTADLTGARVFSVTPGGVVAGIDFVMLDTSVRTIAANDLLAGLNSAFQSLQPASIPIALAVEVHVESGAKLPLFSSGGFTLIQFTEMATSVETKQMVTDSFSINLTVGSPAPQYRVRVANLPEGYVVKSILYDGREIMGATLKIPPEFLPRPTIATVNGVTQTVATSASAAGGTPPALIVTLATVPVGSIPGARVTGSLPDPKGRSLSMASSSGILYSDGTFEFRGVVPGLYNITALGNSGASSFGASVVVGERDVDGVNLQVMAALPAAVRQTGELVLPITQPPGTVLPPVSLRGRLIEEASGMPIEEGTVRLIGGSSAVASVGSGGEFEFNGLLSGNYELEVRIFGHSNVVQHVVVANEPIRVDIKTLRLY